MRRKKVIIDVATIYPGQGGAGGGIWSYALNLLTHLDAHVPSTGIEFICLANSASCVPLQHIKVKVLPFNLQHTFTRLFYVHVWLPVYVALHGAVLHKVYFEAPFFSLSKLLVTIHDCMASFYARRQYVSPTAGARLKARYFKLANANAIKNATHICTPSSFVASELIQDFKISKEKITVTPLAIGAVRPRPQKPKEGVMKFYCVAAFHPHKGHLRLIRLFEHLFAAGAPVELYMRGHVPDSDYFEKVQQAMQRSAFNDRFHVVPYSKKASIDRIYSDADCIILLSEYEGFGLPVIEAQAYGVPVVCSDIPVFREVAGAAAWFIGHDEPDEQAAQKLLSLIDSASDLEQLAAKGMVNASRYSWERFTLQMLDVYKALAVPKGRFSAF